MPKQKVLKNQNGDGDPQQQEQHVGKGQQSLRSMSTNELKLQQQPPRKMTITVKKGGQPREYHYRTTVNSFEELDKFRFQNYCRFANPKHRVLTFMSISIPCSRKMHGKDCDFELRAYRSSNNGNIDVYAYSQHNHPFESEVQRLINTVKMELVPDSNPPSIFRTPDNIEWTFLQTLPDCDTLDKFRRKNNCYFGGTSSDRSTRIRGYCARRSTQTHCLFMLLAVKTRKQHYHLYSYGEHNHHVHNIKRNQKQARGKQKSRQEQIQDEDEEGKVTMEEEQEDEPIDGEQNAEDIAKPGQDEQMETESEKYPLEKCQRRLEKNLRKDNKERTKKWIGRIDRADIGQVIAELDVENVANLMHIADIDISDCEASLDFWLPWIKKSIRKRRAELTEFIMKFKHLRKIESLPNKLKEKIRKMLQQRRLEIEAQKMVPAEETSSDDEN